VQVVIAERGTVRLLSEAVGVAVGAHGRIEVLQG
jgi:hypothetical protein